MPPLRAQVPPRSLGRRRADASALPGRGAVRVLTTLLTILAVIAIATVLFLAGEWALHVLQARELDELDEAEAEEHTRPAGNVYLLHDKERE